MKTMITMALSLIGLGLFAQNTFGEIKGKVFDQETKEAIPFASVYVESNGKLVGTQTDFDGKYTIKPLPAGTYDVKISYLGKQNITITNTVVKPDQITFSENVFMTSGDGEILPDVVIEAPEKLIEEEAHNKVSIGGKAIRNSPVKQDLGQIAVSTGAVSTSADGGEIYFRGARAGDAVYLIDGVKVTGQTPKIPSSGIKNFSVYSGGLPAKYGDTMGGVIVVETKSFFDLYYESLRD